MRVSSLRGLRLLAAAASEASIGNIVGVNWVGKSASVSSGTTKESSNGPSAAEIAGAGGGCCPNEYGSGGYSQNSFDWNYLNGPPGVDIGVTDAWRMLQFAGKLGNKVDLAILDMGFLPNSDFPTGGTAWSVGFFDPIGTIGLDDAWHGTKVVGAAMGVPDNGFGAAGPAGPVARPILIYTFYDPWSSTIALMNAVAMGADIINMSYGWAVPASLAFTVLPFNLTTLLIREGGVLLFASAGNDGENVDAEDCFIACWEEEWVTPCENGGVLCVGGLGMGSIWRAAGSNWGSEEVDIFAPFTVLVGPSGNPANNRAQIVHGTSYSSPYAAGVAALIWAANPALSADQVENILLTHANDSPDPKVSLYVNAFRAIRSILPNLAPLLSITEPSPGQTVGYGPFSQSQFKAKVEDFEDGPSCCAVVWTSNKDGVLGSGAEIQFAFTTPGTRTITATAKDSKGATTTATVTVATANTKPSVQIIKPQAGLVMYRGLPYVFQGKAADPNEPFFSVPCDSLTWTSSTNIPFTTVPIGQGCSPVVTLSMPSGQRTITLTAKDSEGATATAQQTITLKDPPPNTAPHVVIFNPKNNNVLDPYESVMLTGTGDRPRWQEPGGVQVVAQAGRVA